MTRSELRGWWAFARFAVAPLVRAGLRVRTQGLGNLPGSGPAIIASNHVSVLDPVVIAVAVASRERKMHFLAAAELYRLPLIGWALRTMEQIPIRRGQQDAEALETTAAYIRAGAIAGIFPEGKVNADPSALLEGRRGVARIAVASGAPILPVAIWGTQTRWPRGGPKFALPLRTRVGLAVGAPIPVDAYSGSQEDVRALTDLLMGRIGELTTRARELGG